MGERTGSYGFCFITRGHVDDTLDPTWCGSPEAEDFLRQVFNINAWDLARKFEQFACNLSESKCIASIFPISNADACVSLLIEGKRPDTMATMRAECTKMILSSLRTPPHYHIHLASTDLAFRSGDKESRRDDELHEIRCCYRRSLPHQARWLA